MYDAPANMRKATASRIFTGTAPLRVRNPASREQLEYEQEI